MPVQRGLPAEGVGMVYLQGDIPMEDVCLQRNGVNLPPTPPPRMTHASENITFP